jgi:hypothetical protein
MNEDPVNWIVCSRDGLSDDEWRELRLFIASELEKDAAPVGRRAKRQDRETGLGPKGEHAVTAKPAGAQPGEVE